MPACGFQDRCNKPLYHGSIIYFSCPPFPTLTQHAVQHDVEGIAMSPEDAGYSRHGGHECLYPIHSVRILPWLWSLSAGLFEQRYGLDTSLCSSFSIRPDKRRRPKDLAFGVRAVDGYEPLGSAHAIGADNQPASQGPNRASIHQSKIWSQRQDSNLQSATYKVAALSNSATLAQSCSTAREPSRLFRGHGEDHPPRCSTESHIATFKCGRQYVNRPARS